MVLTELLGLRRLERGKILMNLTLGTWGSDEKKVIGSF